METGKVSKSVLMPIYTLLLIADVVALFVTDFSTPSLIGLVVMALASIVIMLTVDM